MVVRTFVVALLALRFTIFLAVPEDDVHVLSSGRNHRKMALRRHHSNYVKALNILYLIESHKGSNQGTAILYCHSHPVIDVV